MFPNVYYMFRYQVDKNMEFEFWAIDPEGNDVRGIRKVRSREQLISDLLREQLVPMEIREPSESQIKLEKFKEVKAKLAGPEPKYIPLADKPIKPDISIDYTYFFFIALLVLCFIAAIFHHA